jgi:hypothetical protein
MIGSLKELARRPGVPSEVTIRKMIDRYSDFPIVERGKNGRKYRIDLEVAEAFIRQKMQPAAPDLNKAALFRLGREPGSAALVREKNLSLGDQINLGRELLRRDMGIGDA